MHDLLSVQQANKVYVSLMHADLVAKLASLVLTCSSRLVLTLCQHVIAALRESR